MSDQPCSKDGGTEPEHKRQLFIGGLNYKTTDATLKKHFEQWGEIEEVIVIKDTATKQSRGFGFVTYTKASTVDMVQSVRPHEIDGRYVKTKRIHSSQDKEQPEPTTNKLFVSNLTEDIEEDDLVKYFENFGIVESATIAVDRTTGKKRGFCCVLFEDYDPVDKICMTPVHEVKGIRVNVKKALKKAAHGGRNVSAGTDDGGSTVCCTCGGRILGGDYVGGTVPWEMSVWGGGAFGGGSGSGENFSLGYGYQQSYSAGPERCARCGYVSGGSRFTPYSRGGGYGGGGCGTGRPGTSQHY